MPRRAALLRPTADSHPPSELNPTPAAIAGETSRRALWLESLSPTEQRTLRHVGLRIAAFRRKRRITLAELAVAADLNAAHLGTIERGENNTTLLSLVRIASALTVDVKALLEVVR